MTEKHAGVLLADDHELFRDALAGLIDDQPELEVVGMAGDGLEALQMAKYLHPDIIVMDINMPICDGLEATRLMRREGIDSHIVILTVHDEDEKLFEAVKSGASGYVLKSVPSSEFLRGLKDVLAGGAPLTPELAANLIDEFASMAARRAELDDVESQPDLTPREQEVLGLIATGAMDKEIAKQLNISIYTVKSHVRNILSKLHAQNRHHAAREAARHGWFNLPPSHDTQPEN